MATPGDHGVVVAAGEVRRSNLLRVLDAVRDAPPTSRTELAEALGLAVPSVHRLVADLVDLEWLEATDDDGLPGRGRPTTRFRFRDERALVLGVDVGSATTRFALTSLEGVIQTRREVPTDELREDLAAGIAGVARKLRASAGLTGRPLAVAGVGVPAVVDRDGRITRPWRQSSWAGVPLRAELRRRLQCEVAVAQDNHFAALAESSAGGTAPDPTSLIVVELGIGIGAGYTVDGQIVSGADGGLGRLMAWPCVPPRGIGGGRTLAELLTADGLLAQYRSRDGRLALANGAELLAAAAGGDRVATKVARWAAGEFAATLYRIALLLNPEVIVVGGGLGRGLFEGGYLDRVELDQRFGMCDLRVSVLASDAVVLGAVKAARQLLPDWLSSALLRV